MLSVRPTDRYGRASRNLHYADYLERGQLAATVRIGRKDRNTHLRCSVWLRPRRMAESARMAVWWSPIRLPSGCWPFLESAEGTTALYPPLHDHADERTTIRWRTHRCGSHRRIGCARHCRRNAATRLVADHGEGGARRRRRWQSDHDPRFAYEYLQYPI